MEKINGNWNFESYDNFKEKNPHKIDFKNSFFKMIDKASLSPMFDGSKYDEFGNYYGYYLPHCALPVYFAGEMIEGVVRLRTNKIFKLHSIEIELEGMR